VAGRFSPVAGALFTVAERIAARWTAAIVCVSEAERRLALERRIASPALLEVVHNGVADIPAELRAQPGAKGPLRICSIARFQAPKDHATLLAALARISGCEWELQLIGDGPLEAEVRSLAGRLGLDGRVRIAGYMSDPAPVLASASVFALSSRSEGFPRSVLEAMRAGLPVAVSDVGGVREAVEHGKTGLLVPPGDPSALAAALGRLLSAPELRDRMGAAGRAAFESQFRLETMVDRTALLYERVLEGHRLARGADAR
jgi:glycosyltransferase involved in cell wall biosynthesis